MELREVLLVGHILGVVAMAFGTGTGMLSTMAAGSSPDLRTIVSTTRLELLGGRVTTFAAIVVFAFGVWLVIETSYEFSEAWISASFVLWFIAMGLGGAVMARHARRVGEAAQAALGRGETTSAEVQADFAAPIAKVTGAVLLLMYVAFIYLMVAKPGA